MPNQHDAVDAGGQEQRDVTTVSDFHGICSEKAGIDYDKQAGDCGAILAPCR
jgi:hypothetical protein